MSFFRTQEVTGIKPHTCLQCGKTIATGERHHYSAGKIDGDFQSYREHLDCLKLWFEIRGLRDLAFDEESEVLRDDDFVRDRGWMRKEYPLVAERLFGPSTTSHSEPTQ